MKQASSHFYPSSERQKRRNKLREPSTALSIRLHCAITLVVAALFVWPLIGDALLSQRSIVLRYSDEAISQVGILLRNARC
jgi:hypothetical protein